VVGCINGRKLVIFFFFFGSACVDAVYGLDWELLVGRAQSVEGCGDIRTLMDTPPVSTGMERVRGAVRLLVLCSEPAAVCG